MISILLFLPRVYVISKDYLQYHFSGFREVISADMREGVQVEEGAVLYVIDSTSMESELSSVQNFSGAESGIL